MVTTDARQIAITKVDQDSPADGILKVGDVVLGIGDTPFSYLKGELGPSHGLLRSLFAIQDQLGSMTRKLVIARIVNSI